MKLLLFGATLVYLALPGQIAMPEPSGWATTIAWSPDGETIAVGSSDGLWFFDDEFNVVGYVATPQFEGFPPTTMDWSADGELIALAINWLHYPHFAEDGRIYTGEFPILVVDVKRHEVTQSIEFPRPSSELRWHPQDRVILIGILGGTAHILNAITGEEEYVYFKETKNGHEVSIFSVCWVTGSVVALMDHTALYVVDTLKNELLHRISIRRSSSPLHYTASCDNSGRAVNEVSYSFDLHTGQSKGVFSMDNNFTISDYWYHEWNLVAIAYSPDGTKIATNGNSSLCRTAVFDGNSHQLIAELQGSYVKSNLRLFRDSIAWHPSGNKLAMVGQFDIRIWDGETFELLQRFDGFNAGHYEPHPKSNSSDNPETHLRKNTRHLRCPDFPASMLFREQT